MRLRVPLMRQPKNSAWCGPACVAMVMKYYDDSVNLKDVKKEIKMHKTGAYVPQLGLYLRNKGFDVELVTFNPLLFTHKRVGNSTDSLLKYFQHLRRIKFYKKSKDMTALNYLIDFLRAGGKISVKVPTESDVRSEIAHHRPLLANLTSDFFFKLSLPRFNFHYNVITGIDKEYVYVNDPGWGAYGGRNKHKIADFIYAVSAITHNGIFEGYLMKISNSNGV